MHNYLLLTNSKKDFKTSFVLTCKPNFLSFAHIWMRSVDITHWLDSIAHWMRYDTSNIILSVQTRTVGYMDYWQQKQSLTLFLDNTLLALPGSRHIPHMFLFILCYYLLIGDVKWLTLYQATSYLEMLTVKLKQCRMQDSMFCILFWKCFCCI